MNFSELPVGTRFLDIEGIAVAVLPDATHVAFETKAGNESRPYPDSARPGSDMGDVLSRDECATWLETGFNRFDLKR